jgi:hypothetical protein
MFFTIIHKRWSTIYEFNNRNTKFEGFFCPESPPPPLVGYGNPMKDMNLISKGESKSVLHAV